MSTVKTTYLQHPSATNPNLTLASDGTVSGLVPGRNAVINGAMTVYQRGQSTASSATAFALDRWNNFRGSGATGITVTQQNASLPGFQKCARIQRDSGNTSTASFYFVQNFETINSIPFQGKQLTLSFWARAGANFSPTGGYLRASIEGAASTDSQYWNIGDGAATTLYVQENKVLTTSWQQFYVTGTMNSAHTQLFTAFKWTPTGTAGAADYVEVTGVQLDVGSTPSVFEYETFEVTLRKCQRYYEKSFPVDTVPANGVYSSAYLHFVHYQDTWAYMCPWVPFKATKRVAPSIAFYGNSSSAWQRSNGDATWFDMTAIYTLDGQGGVGSKVNGMSVSTHAGGASGLAYGSVRSFRGDWTANAEI